MPSLEPEIIVAPKPLTATAVTEARCPCTLVSEESSKLNSRMTPSPQASIRRPSCRKAQSFAIVMPSERCAMISPRSLLTMRSRPSAVVAANRPPEEATERLSTGLRPQSTVATLVCEIRSHKWIRPSLLPESNRRPRGPKAIAVAAPPPESKVDSGSSGIRASTPEPKAKIRSSPFLGATPLVATPRRLP